MNYIIITDKNIGSREITVFESRIGMEIYFSFLNQKLMGSDQSKITIETGGEEILTEIDKEVLNNCEMEYVPVSDFMMRRCTYEDFETIPLFIDVATVDVPYEE